MWIRKLNSKAVEAPIKRVKRNLAILANWHKTITWFYFIFKSKWKYKSELNCSNYYIKGLWKIVENYTHIFRVCVFLLLFSLSWPQTVISVCNCIFGPFSSSSSFLSLLLLSSFSFGKNLNITGRGAEACARLSVVDMVLRECVCESGSRSWWVGCERPVNSFLPVALLPFEFVASQNEPRAIRKCPPGSWQAVHHQLQLFSLTDELNVDRKSWVMFSLLSCAKFVFHTWILDRVRYF